MNKKVVVGISGGVDSAVTALLLKQQGYDVIGIFMQNWDSYTNQEDYDNHRDHCDSYYEYEDAKKVCKKLAIPLYKIDFIKEYWDEVFQTFLDQYCKGLTPNPDVLCNKYIKFGHLLKHSLQNFSCDYIATGHYAKVKHFDDHHELHRCIDENKDQTYFLCGLNQEQLSKCLFPLANLTKQQVRNIAHEAGLINWDKKDSTGICFIGERNFQSFLKNYIAIKPGDIVDIDTNKVIAKHHGIAYYTIGQNNKLGLSGQAYKYFVVDKDVNQNILLVAREANKDKYLQSFKCRVSNFNFINYPIQTEHLQVRFRHRQPLIDCNIEIIDNHDVLICYPKGSLGVTKGQYAVLYDGTNCLGGGEIIEIFKD